MNKIYNHPSPPPPTAGLIAIAVLVTFSNTAILLTHYAFPHLLSMALTERLIEFLSMLAVFPLHLFVTYLPGLWVMHLYWLVSIMFCAIGLLRYNRLARMVFIVFNVIHIVTFFLILAQVQGTARFLDHFFKLYFNLVASASYVAYITIPDVRKQFEHRSIGLERFNFWLKRISAGSPGMHPAGFYNLGVAYSRMERYADAVTALEKAVKADSSQAPYWLALGKNYYHLKRWADAAAAYKRAVDIDPLLGDGYLELGCVLLHLGCAAEAVDAMEKAGHLHRDRPELFIRLGVAYASLQRFSEALANYRKALNLDVNNSEAYYRMGQVYLEHLDQPKEAEQVLRKAVLLNSASPEINTLLGLTAMRLNRYKEAIHAFKEALVRDPKNMQIHFQLGFCYATVKDFESARREHRLLTQNDPDLASNLEMMLK